MQPGLKIDPAQAALSAFCFSLPLTGVSLIQSDELVRAFAPSLFLSLPFLALHAWRRDVLRSPVLRQLSLPFLLLAVAGLASIYLNTLSPAQVLVHTPDMAIQEPNSGLPLLERYFRLLYSLVVVAVLGAVVLKDQPSLNRFCRTFVAGYSLGAAFGAGQWLADLLRVPFWTPFGGASWMQSHQTTDFGITRINGGAPEPSHWAPFSLMAITFIMISAQGPFSRRRWAVLSLAVFNLIFTLSGSAIMGILGCLAGIALYRATLLFSWKIRLSRTLAVFIGVPLALGVLVLLISRLEVFNTYFGEGLLLKISGQNESGAARLYIMVLTWLAFVAHPLYGVGVGTVASFNTVLTMLGSGGLFFFLPYAYLVAAGGWRTLSAYRREPGLRNRGWYLFYWSMLFITTFAYGEIFSFFSWLWIAFCFVRKPASGASVGGKRS